MVKKCEFLKVVKIPYPKNRFLVILRSFFSTYKFFPGQWWLFPVSIFQLEYFNEKMSSLAGLKLYNFPQKYWFWPIFATWVHLQSRFSQCTGKNSKNPWSVSWGRFLGTLCWIFSFLSSKRCGGGLAVLQVDIFQYPWFLLVVNLWGGHLKLVMLVLLLFSNPSSKTSTASNVVDFCWLFVS